MLGPSIVVVALLLADVQDEQVLAKDGDGRFFLSNEAPTSLSADDIQIIRTGLSDGRVAAVSVDFLLVDRTIRLQCPWNRSDTAEEQALRNANSRNSQGYLLPTDEFDDVGFIEYWRFPRWSPERELLDNYPDKSAILRVALPGYSNDSNTATLVIYFITKAKYGGSILILERDGAGWTVVGESNASCAVP